MAKSSGSPQRARSGLDDSWIPSSGGWLRSTFVPLFLLLTAPLASLLLWVVSVPFEGSLLRAFAAGPGGVAEHLPGPSWSAAAIIAAWLIGQALLLRLLPARIHLGTVTPAGTRPAYRINGVSAFLATHALLLLIVGPLELLPPTLIYDHFGELLATSSLMALLLCTWLYLRARFLTQGPDTSLTGNPILDFFWGTELHPTLAGLQLKQLFNARYAMMGWSVIILSFAAKQWEVHGYVSTGMLVNVALQLVYIGKFFLWEDGYFNSLDVMHDRFGFYIAWGVSAWLPSLYTIHTLYLVHHPADLSMWLALPLFALGLGGITINFLADKQRQRVRETDGETLVWGRRPEIIHATYVPLDGRPRHSILLASGWWGMARHFHYVPEIVLAIAWTLPAGFASVVPWLYVLFLAILLTDRAGRDDRRCQSKYGSSWSEYCRRVPYRIIPGVY